MKDKYGRIHESPEAGMIAASAWLKDRAVGSVGVRRSSVIFGYAVLGDL